MEKEYKKIDVLKYVSEGVKRGELTFAEAKKFKRIYATVGTLGQVVPTILSDGTIETERVVSLDPKTGKPGWVVKNISSPEQWIISDSTFQKKYEADPEQEGVYRPKGKNMLAAQISEDIEFAPPMWVETFKE